MSQAHYMQPYDVPNSSRRTRSSHSLVRSERTHALTNVHPAERWLSTLAGASAVAWGLARRSPPGSAAALLGSALVYRGVSGHCQLYQALGVNTAERQGSAARSLHKHSHHYDVLRSVTVQKSAAEVYRAWRDPETFARAMSHFASLGEEEGGRMRWTVRDPLGHAHSWTTEVVEDQPNRSIRWSTTAEAPLVKSLTLELSEAPGRRGTEMKLHLRMSRPAGALGNALTKLLGSAPAWFAERALGNVKSLLEAGELASLEHNPAAR